MLTINRKTEYALLALIELAAKPCSHSVRALADKTGLSRNLLGKILQDLHRGGLVTSQQGARGGYTLATSPKDIAILDIMTLVEGVPALTPCQRGQMCKRSGTCRLENPMITLNQNLNQLFQRMTLEDVLNSPVRPALEN